MNTKTHNNINELIKFKRLKLKHLSYMLKWLNKEHVKKFWDSNIPWTKELVFNKYESYIKGFKYEKNIKKPIYAYIIYYDKLAIGYIQFYNAYDFLQENNILSENFPKSLASFDIFIGEEEYTNKGLGSKIINKFLQNYIFKKFNNCFTAPEITNKYAIKAYNNAGFVEITELQGQNPLVKFMICKNFS